MGIACEQERDRMDLDRRIRDSARSWGADFVGVADLTPTHDAIARQWGPVIAGYPRAVSLGIALLHPIVDQLPRQADREAAMTYRHHAYDVINQRLDLITSEIASSLQAEGSSAFPVPASERFDDKRLCASFSHKLAANLSGLGWIGKSCLLVTPEHGPRVRWATVLTDAALDVTGQPVDDQCGDCTLCVDICPVQAFTGKHFRKEEPRDARYMADKCDRYFKGMEAKGKLKVCGMCLYVCPFGKKTNRQEASCEMK